ncbi:MAG: major facilitator superfamily 1, partial [Nocardioides sp.]|nr:major facilitator superfamily 1 [Nocardioides sp.]
MPSYRSLARNHDFTVLWVGQTISELGSRVSMFVFPLITYAMTGSALLAALAEAVHLLGLAATLLPAGVLADRVDRLRIMRFASGTGVLLYSSLAVAGVAGVLTVPHLLAVALLTGAGAGLFAPAEISAVRTVVPADELPTALSQNQARLHVAGLLGAPLGGVLYAVTRWLPFAADAVSFAASWLLLGRLRTDLAAPQGDGPRRRPRQDLAEGIRFIASRPFFRAVTLWGALTNLAVNALFFVAVLRLIEGGFDPLQIGLVETAAGLAGIVGAIVAPWLIERMPTGWLTVTIAWSFLPLVVPMALWNTPEVVAAAVSLGMLLNPAGNAGMSSYRIAITPPALIGRVQSTSQFVSMSAMPLAPVLAGALLSGLGGGRAIAVLGSFTACVALIPTL